MEHDQSSSTLSVTHTNKHYMGGATLFVGTLTLVLLFLLRRRVGRKPTNAKQQRRVPEPPGAWPVIGHLPLLGGNGTDSASKVLGAMADKYGAVYSLRVGVNNLLVVSGSEVVKECLTINDQKLATRASIAVGKHMGYDNAVVTLAPQGPYWRHIRKMATVQLLSTHSIEAMAHVRDSEVNAFLKDLHAESGKERNMSELLERIAFNMILRMVVGKRFDGKEYAEEKSDVRRYKEAVAEGVRLSGVFVPSDAVPWLEWFDFGGHLRDMKKATKVVDEVVGKWLNERRIEGRRQGAEQDFVDVMLASLASGDLAPSTLAGHSIDTIIKATTLILTLTGTGSTSTTIIWALAHLINNPYALKAAREELDREVGRERWVEEADLRNLTYLQAIAKETMRLHPAGTLTGIREAMEDCTIAGYDVPKGTRVVINIWKVHRDPKVWDEPNEFRPDRFLTTHADIEFIGHNNFKFIPLTYGRRSCPGGNLGVRVVMLVLARAIQGFHFATPPNVDFPIDMDEDKGLAMAKKTPLLLVPTPRLSSDLYSHL